MIELHSAASINKSIAKAYAPTRTNDSQVNLFDSLPDSASCPTFANVDTGSVRTSGEISELISAISFNEVIADHNSPSAKQKTEPVFPGSIQLLTTYGGLSLPQELTLSILEMLKADDQIETLANFQQCSQSCQELVRPFIWDEMVISMRGSKIVWDIMESSQRAEVVDCPSTSRQGKLWDNLTRLKKIRIVEVGHNYVKDTFASLDDALATEPPPLPFDTDQAPVRSSETPLPFDSLEHVKVTKTVGAQIFDQITVHWPLFPKVTNHKRPRIISWLREFTKPFASTFLLGEQPIDIVDVEMPPHPKYRKIKCRRKYSSEMDIARMFYSRVQLLTRRSQALRMHDLEIEGTNAEDCIPYPLMDKRCSIIYRMPMPNEAWSFARTVQGFFRDRVSQLLDRLCSEIDGTCRKSTMPPTLSIRIPSSCHAETETESLYSMNNRDHLKTLAEDWPLSRKYAWVISKTIEVHSEAYLDEDSYRHPDYTFVRPHSGVKAADFGEEGLFGRACQRVHLDLTGLDDLAIDETTAHFFSIKSLTWEFERS